MNIRRCLRESGRSLRVFTLTCGVILCGALATQTIQAQQRRPLSRQEIVRLLKGDVTPKRVAELARERGIDFQVTAEVETQLRAAGADGGLISVLRDVAPKPAPPPAAKRAAEGTAGPAPGTVRENFKDGLKYVWIPSGTFMMGCSPGDNDCHTDEKPPHRVTISKGFWLGQTPVTVVAYRRFAGATGRAMPPAPYFNADWNTQEMPIVNVTWVDAQAYCAWAGGRLPTEAEWEYAARAGSTEAHYGPLDDIGWYGDNSGRQRLDSLRIWQTDRANYSKRLIDNGNGTHDVAQKKANAWNLYDMLGNVWEWLSDWYGENYYPASPDRDPQGPESGQFRVLRGGSWDNGPGNVRVSVRFRGDPGPWLINLGFRCGGEVFAP